jgi:hypothetical protein
MPQVRVCIHVRLVGCWLLAGRPAPAPAPAPAPSPTQFNTLPTPHITSTHGTHDMHTRHCGSWRRCHLRDSGLSVHHCRAPRAAACQLQVAARVSQQTTRAPSSCLSLAAARAGTVPMGDGAGRCSMLDAQWAVLGARCSVLQVPASRDGPSPVSR